MRFYFFGIILSGMLWSGLLWAEKPSSPQLGLGVPSDCFCFFQAKVNDKWAPLATGVREIGRRLAASQALEAVLEAVFQAEEKDARRGEINAWRSLLEAAEWQPLFQQEVVVGLRYDFSMLSVGLPPTLEVLLLSRVDSQERTRVSEGLERILGGLAALGRDLVVERRVQKGVATMVVRSVSEPSAEICLGGRPDVIALATSSKLLRQSLQLLDGRTSAPGVVLNEQYAQAMGRISPTKDFEFYVRPADYFDHLRLEVKRLEETGGNSPAALEASEFRYYLDRIIETFDLVESGGLTGSFKGNAVVGDFSLVLRKDGDRRVLYPIFGSQPPLDNVVQSLPKETRLFLHWSGVDFQKLSAVIDGLATRGPDEWTSVWKAMQGFRERDQKVSDLFDLLEMVDGRVMVVGVPIGPAAARRDHIVVKMHVRDAVATQRRLRRLIATLRDEKGSSLKEENGRDTARYSLNLPAALGTMELVFGIRGEELFCGTSPEAVVEMFESSNSDRIARQLTSLGVSTAGSPHWVSYLEFDVLLPWVRSLLGMVSLAEAVVSKVDPASSSPQAALVSRLAPAVGALGFMEKTAAAIERDGNLYRGRWALTFRSEKKENAEEKEKTRQKF